MTAASSPGTSHRENRVIRSRRAGAPCNQRGPDRARCRPGTRRCRRNGTGAHSILLRATTAPNGGAHPVPPDGWTGRAESREGGHRTRARCRPTSPGGHRPADLHGRRSRLCRAGDGQRLPGGDVPLDRPGADAGPVPGRAKGHGARVPSIIRSADRSASAAIVRHGFGPTGPGMMEPSTMKNPG